MTKKSLPMMRTLTLRCLVALGVVAALALANYLLLREEMRANETGAELLSISGRQRTLMHSTALLAQELVTSDDEVRRDELREELTAAVEPLEKAHFQLVEFDPLGSGEPLPEVQEIYESTPWLLDTEVRNYLTHLRELARSDDAELTLVNPLYRYIRDVWHSRRITDGLDAVVAAYQDESVNRAAQLQQMARSSLISTWVVLGLTGIFVMRPMVLRVRDTVNALHGLNETLENRVAERTRIADQRAQKLADSEALYHSLVENLPLAVARKDLEGRYTYVNRLYCELTGREPAETIGATDADFCSPTDAARSRRDDSRVIQSRQVLQQVQRHNGPDGSAVYWELLKAPVLDAAETVIGTQTVFWDITQRKASEERMLRAERLAAVGEMVTRVAHESRNALQQIGACAKMLEWQLEGQDEANELIGDIHKAHDRLHRLFENLRSYVSPLKPDLRAADLKDIWMEAWKSTAALRTDRRVELVHRGDDSDLRCSVDPFAVEQVFRNLIENALAACEDPVCIVADWEVDAGSDPSTVRLTVRDNGPGIGTEIADRIFEPFFTTKTQGTGLGMVIARRIVEAHGGSLRVVPPGEAEPVETVHASASQGGAAISASSSAGDSSELRTNGPRNGAPRGAHLEVILPRGDA